MSVIVDVFLFVQGLQATGGGAEIRRRGGGKAPAPFPYMLCVVVDLALLNF